MAKKKMKSLIEAHGTRESKEIFEKWSDNIKAVQSVDNNFSDEEGLKLGIVLENTQAQLDKAEQVYEATQPVDVGPLL